MQSKVWSREPERTFENRDGSRKYERGIKLGEGTYGRVYACCELPGKDKFFAVKIVDAAELHASGCSMRVLQNMQNREAENMQTVKGHPNILQFKEAFGDSTDWLYFVTELVIDPHTKRSVSLDAYMYRHPLRRFAEAEARAVLRQIAAGVRHLHAANIIHRDLKLENVLVDRNLAVKIIDFGLSRKIVDGLSQARTKAGSEKYWSPEVMRRSGHDCSTDLWSLGILIFVMLCGDFPKSTQKAQLEQREIDAEMNELTDISEDARSVLLGLLRIQPTERISLDAPLTRRWLAEAPTARSGFRNGFILPLIFVSVITVSWTTFKYLSC